MLKPTFIMFSTILSFFTLFIYLFTENKQRDSHLKEITETSVQHYERKPGAILGCFPLNTSREQCESKTFGHKEDTSQAKLRAYGMTMKRGSPGLYSYESSY